MRIIAGKFRRRKLYVNPGMVTRPITDRGKEILFERLGERLEGRRVADVFSGTGSMGLEALSRGAATAIFLEKDRVAFELLEKNVEMLGVQERTLCWRTDILLCSFRPKGVDHLLPIDFYFFDPPYAMVRDLRPGTKLTRAVERMARPDVSAPNTLLMFRAPVDEQFQFPPCWTLDNQFDISSMRFFRYRKTDNPGTETSGANVAAENDLNTPTEELDTPAGDQTS